MRRRSVCRAAAGAPLAALAMLAVPRAIGAQQVEPEPLAAGTTAPELGLEGATRFGQLLEPVRLEGFRGKTVVLAFFFRARTPG